MDITHLVVNGCSFTYGQGLEDPASDAWPALLGKMLDCDVVNLALPGSSNDGIVRRTYEYFYQNLEKNSKPIFIFGWTIPSRVEFYHVPKDTYFTIFPGIHFPGETEKIDLNKILYAFFSSDNDDLRRILQNKIDIINMMRLTKTPYLSYDFSEHFNELQLKPSNNHKLKHMLNYVNTDEFTMGHVYDDDLRKGCSALPCGHDGIEGHKRIANKIYNDLIKKYQSINVISGEYTQLFDLPHTYIKHPKWIKWKDSKN